MNGGSSLRRRPGQCTRTQRNTGPGSQSPRHWLRPRHGAPQPSAACVAKVPWKKVSYQSHLWETTGKPVQILSGRPRHSRSSGTMLPRCNSGPKSWRRQRPTPARRRTVSARAGNIAMCRKRWRACAQRRSRPAGWRNRLKWCHSRTSQAKELKTWRKLRNRIPEPAGETIRAPGRMRLPGLIGWPSTRCTPLWSYPRNSSSASRQYPRGTFVC